MKMKMSVVLGIFQMTLGIVLKALNAKYFNQPLDFYLEFIPMIVFDVSLFGYMVRTHRYCMSDCHKIVWLCCLQIVTHVYTESCRFRQTSRLVDVLMCSHPFH